MYHWHTCQPQIRTKQSDIITRLGSKVSEMQLGGRGWGGEGRWAMAPPVGRKSVIVIENESCYIEKRTLKTELN